MKQVFRFYIIVGVLCLPTVAFAQTPWYQRYDWAGVSERRIEQLGDDIVSEIPVPLLFGVKPGDFSPNFGVPRSGGRSHEGQDLLAPRGTPIVSPTDAVVTHIRYGTSAGHSVYTANPGGETFAYLHLDAVSPLLAVGDVLNRGDLIGFNGDTGNAAGTPHLHFEILTDVAHDPFPRLTTSFSPIEQMVFLKAMLQELPTAERSYLIRVMQTEFADEIATIRSQGVAIPAALSEVITDTPSDPDTATTNEGWVSFGNVNTAIVELQQYLIDLDAGPAARALADAGATGYFGTLTKSAVSEYQFFVALPQTGEYDAATRAAIEGVTQEDTTVVPPPSPQPTAPVVTDVPSVNLTLEDRGDAVAWLQLYLIQADAGSAARTLAGYGATGYFGGVTRDALAEFQRIHGIEPAVGYYGPVTRSFVKQSGV